MTEEKPSQSGRIALGAISAVVIALVGFFLLPEPDPVLAPAPVEIAVATPEPVPPPEPPAAPGTVAEEPPALADAPAAPAPGPQFDTFRLETDGTMLIAGRTAPGGQVDVVLGDDTIASATGDESGNFVIFAEAPPSDAPRRLSLLGDPGGSATRSETSYMVAPIAAPVVVAEAPPLVLLPEPAAEEVAELPPPAAPAPVAVTPDLPQPPELPTVLQADADGVRVVQTTPQPVPNVALDAITYDPAGEVALSGRATGDGEVQVYLDNRPVTSSTITQGGDWQIDLPQVDTGVYTLRIDELNLDGDVVSRIETPFKREEADDVAAVLAEETEREGFDVAVRTVQPGSTLWAIAEENLGDGIYYVAVFEANRDLIKDPDLIYPGQIFRIPDRPE